MPPATCLLLLDAASTQQHNTASPGGQTVHQVNLLSAQSTRPRLRPAAPAGPILHSPCLGARGDLTSSQPGVPWLTAEGEARPSSLGPQSGMESSGPTWSSPAALSLLQSHSSGWGVLARTAGCDLHTYTLCREDPCNTCSAVRPEQIRREGWRRKHGSFHRPVAAAGVCLGTRWAGTCV